MPLAFILVAATALLFIAWQVAHPLLVERRRRRVRARPFPQEWRRILRERLPLYRRLPADLQRQLRDHIQVFVAEKEFIGCRGREITDEVRVTIAAQACLLVLNRNTGYFPRLRQILVYPGAFLVERLRAEPSGVLQEHRQVLSGESWTQGQVVLSWEDVVEGAAIADDGRNVVIHEFAHQLDQQKGFANGAPVRTLGQRSPAWPEILGREFARLQDDALWQRPSLLSHYGATNPAEFFAVASEAFFEQPQRMAVEHPALYGELARLYRVDPAGW
jgi:Mlc titration factor MtfA (ptsG expression regulator)